MKTSFPRNLQKKITLNYLIESLGDEIELLGNKDNQITSVSAPHNAESGSLVFIDRTKTKDLVNLVSITKASVIVVSEKIPAQKHKSLIITQDPRGWFISALKYLTFNESDYQINPTEVVSNNYSIDKSARIGANTFISSGCIIESDCVIGSNCFIGPNTHIMKKCFIQCNSSIGVIGLGYHFNLKRERLLFPHLGRVLIGTDVVIGSNCVIVKGQLDDTTIGNSTRIGNLVNVGHNVQIGEHCAISSGTCIAGGVRIGYSVNVAMGVKINAKIFLDDHSQVGLGSVVTKSVQANQSVFGNPAKRLRTMKKF